MLMTLEERKLNPEIIISQCRQKLSSIQLQYLDSFEQLQVQKLHKELEKAASIAPSGQNWAMVHKTKKLKVNTSMLETTEVMILKQGKLPPPVDDGASYERIPFT